MKKDVSELTPVEDAEFRKELLRIFVYGTATQIVAAKNANEDSKGWPHIIFPGETGEVEVSFCHALETILEYNQERMIKGIGILAFTMSAQEVMAQAIHEAMHDAFCIGLGAATMMEIDLTGMEEKLDELNKNFGNPE